MEPLFPSTFSSSNRTVAYQDLKAYFASLTPAISSCITSHLSTLFTHFTTDISTPSSALVSALEAAAWIFSAEFLNSSVMDHVATTEAVYDFLEELTHLVASYIECIQKQHDDTSIVTPLSTLLFLVSEQCMPQLFEPYSLSFLNTITALLQLTLPNTSPRVSVSASVQTYAYRALCNLLCQHKLTLSVSMLELLQSAPITSFEILREIDRVLRKLPLERCQELVPDCKFQAADYLSHVRSVLTESYSPEALEHSTLLWCCLIRLLRASDIYFLMKQGSTGTNSAGLLLQPFQVIHSRSAVAGVKCWTTLLTVISSDDENWLQNVKFVRVLFRYLNTVISAALSDSDLLQDASQALTILCTASWPHSHLLFDIDFSVTREPFTLSHLLNKYLIIPTESRLRCYFTVLSSFLSAIHPHHTAIQSLFRQTHNPSLVPLLPTDKAIFPVLLKHLSAGLRASTAIDDISMLQSAVKLWQELILVAGYRLVTSSSQHHMLLTLDADGGELMVLTSADDVAISVLGCVHEAILDTWKDVWCGVGAPFRVYVIESYFWILHRTSGFDTVASLPRIEHAYNAPPTHVGVAMLLAVHDAILLSEQDTVLEEDCLLLIAVKRCMHAIVESMALPALLAWIPSIVSMGQSSSDALLITEVLHCEYVENLISLICTFLSAAAGELSHMSSTLDANINDDTKRKMIDGLRTVIVLPISIAGSASRGMRNFEHIDEWAQLCEVWCELNDAAGDDLSRSVAEVRICAYKRSANWQHAAADITTKLYLVKRLRKIRQDCAAKLLVALTVDWWCGIEAYVKSERDATQEDPHYLLQSSLINLLLDSLVDMSCQLRRVQVELMSEYSVARRHSNSSTYSLVDAPPSTLTRGSGLYITLSILGDAIVKLLDINREDIAKHDVQKVVIAILTCWTSIKPQSPQEVEAVTSCIYSLQEMNLSEVLQLYIVQFLKDIGISAVPDSNGVDTDAPKAPMSAISAITPQKRSFIKASPTPPPPVTPSVQPSVLGKRPISDDEYITVSRPITDPERTPRQWAVPALHSKLDRSNLASQSQVSEFHTQSNTDDTSECLLLSVAQKSVAKENECLLIPESMLSRSIKCLSNIIASCRDGVHDDDIDENFDEFVNKAYELLGVALVLKQKRKK